MKNPIISLSLQEASDRKFLLIILFMAFVLRSVWVIMIRPAPVCDFSFYYNEAVLIATGNGYVTPGGTPTAFWPVGYPAFLAAMFILFGSSYLVASFANVVLSVATLYFFYRVCCLVTENRIVARAAMVVVMFFPSQIAFCSLVSDTVLFQFLLYSGLFLLLKYKSLFSRVVCGLVFGLAAYVRPYIVVLPFILLLLYRSSWKGFCSAAVLLCLGTVLVLMPWAIRNYNIFHAFIPVSNNGGLNLLIGNSAASTGCYIDPDIDTESYDNELDLDHAAMKKAICYIKEHPFKTLSRTISKLYYMFNDDSTVLWWNIAGYRFAKGRVPGRHFTKRNMPAVILFQAYYMILLAGAAGYFFCRFFLKTDMVMVDNICLYVIIYFSLVAVIFFGDSRFRFPANPLIGLYAVAFFYSIAGLLTRKLKGHN